jgi:hypothetical protein
MKVQTIQGVPYYINDKHEIFLYEENANKSISSSNAATTNLSVSIGVWDPARQHLQLQADWQTKIQPQVETYRMKLKEKTDTEMAKAKELQKV